MTNSSGFPDLVLKAATDAGFRERLFSNPMEIAGLYALNEAEEASLEKLTPQKLDALVGNLLAHKVLPRRVSKRFTVAPLGSDGKQPSDTITIQIDQRKTGVSIGKDGVSMGGQHAFGSGIHPYYISLFIRARRSLHGVNHLPRYRDRIRNSFNRRSKVGRDLSPRH